MSWIKAGKAVPIKNDESPSGSIAKIMELICSEIFFQKMSYPGEIEIPIFHYLTVKDDSQLEPISKLKSVIIMHEVERCAVGNDTGALSGGKHSG